MPIRQTYSETLGTATTTSAAGNGSAFDVSDMSEGVVFINVTAHAGGGPTITFKLQGSHDATTWFDMDTSWSAMTAVSTQVNKITNFGKWVRVAWTVSGSPAATFTVSFIGKS